MVFDVSIHRQDSTYDDSPAERYQVPHQISAACSLTGQDEHCRRCGPTIAHIRISCSGIGKIASNRERERIGAEAHL